MAATVLVTMVAVAMVLVATVAVAMMVVAVPTMGSNGSGYVHRGGISSEGSNSDNHYQFPFELTGLRLPFCSCWSSGIQRRNSGVMRDSGVAQVLQLTEMGPVFSLKFDQAMMRDYRSK